MVNLSFCQIFLGSSFTTPSKDRGSQHKPLFVTGILGRGNTQNIQKYTGGCFVVTTQFEEYAQVKIGSFAQFWGDSSKKDSSHHLENELTFV